MLNTNILKNRVIKKVIIEDQKGTFRDYPLELNDEIKEYLKTKKIEKLYGHQFEMFKEAKNGGNIVITTSTASGKTFTMAISYPDDGAVFG